ncbi:MAG: EAL domain-containing protein [Phycisphaerales bacterium JB059]
MTTDLTPKTDPALTASRLRRVVEEGLLEARFQPIVELRRGRIAAYECLSRPAEELGFANPSELFETAEREGRLWDVEQVAREQSFAAASAWPEGTMLFMNCSPQVIADPRFLESLMGGLERVGAVTPRRVVIEITERSDEQADCVVLDQVQQLRDAGFQIAIDDVGAGTSGLNRIMSIRPAWLKLDRALVSEIDRDRAKKNLVRFMVHFARLSGVRIIAEGIERREELGALIELGVEYGQGYLLGRPGNYDQRLDPELQDLMRAGWKSVAGVTARDPRTVGVVSLMSEATRMSAEQTATEGARVCLQDRSLQGVLVMDGHEALGWAPREVMLRAASDGRADLPLSSLLGADAPRVCGSTTIVEALDIAAARSDADAALPLIIADGERVQGIVTIRDLLGTAAQVCLAVQTRTNQTTGLPGRVRCDEQAIELIERHGARSEPGPPGPDVAFVDIRNLASYNRAFGYDLGDELIQELVGQLCSVVGACGRDAFLGHIGDDRFMLVASPGRIRSIASKLCDGFDRRLRHNDRLVTTSTGRPAPVGLRIGICSDAFRRVASLDDFYRLERSAHELPCPGEDSAVLDIAPSDVRAA